MELLYTANPDKKCRFGISNPFAIDFTNPRICFCLNDSPTPIWRIIDWIEKSVDKPLHVDCYDNTFRTFTKDSPFCFEYKHYIDRDGEDNLNVIEAIMECVDEEESEDEEEQTEMTLGELRDFLSSACFDHNIRLKYGFHKPHSYRENYFEVAVEPTTNVSINMMLDSLKDATRGGYVGYKGGEFYYSYDTPIHIAEYGCGEIPFALNKIIKYINNCDRCEYYADTSDYPLYRDYYGDDY